MLHSPLNLVETTRHKSKLLRVTFFIVDVVAPEVAHNLNHLVDIVQSNLSEIVGRDGSMVNRVGSYLHNRPMLAIHFVEEDIVHSRAFMRIQMYSECVQNF